MKELFIVRHAKSSWSDPGLRDFDRPLNGRGRAAAPEMGRRLAAQGILPDLLLSSPANRAISTARLIAEKLRYPQAGIAEDEELYHASALEILNILRRQPEGIGSLMIFGHNPGFTDFASELTGVMIDNVPTAGVVAVDLSLDTWEALSFGSGSLRFFDYPKKERGV